MAKLPTDDGGAKKFDDWMRPRPEPAPRRPVARGPAAKKPVSAEPSPAKLKVSPHFDAAWEAVCRGEDVTEARFPGLRPEEKVMLAILWDSLKERHAAARAASPKPAAAGPAPAPAPKPVVKPAASPKPARAETPPSVPREEKRPNVLARAWNRAESFFNPSSPVASWRLRRDVYAFLSMTLGIFGAHNFYAGNYLFAVCEFAAGFFIQDNFDWFPCPLLYWIAMAAEGMNRRKTPRGDLYGDPGNGVAAGIAVIVVLFIASCVFR